MRIAQISPLFESVPPKLYGGTERVVHSLTECLVAMGHDVTLFASQDSRTSAELVSIGHDALRLNAKARADFLLLHYLLFEQVRKLQQEFDIIHFHTELMHFPVARALKTPTLSTMHGRQDAPGYPEIYAEYSELPLVSISANQRTPVAEANWIGTVPHGIDPANFCFHPRGSGYLAFLGRLSPEKGFHTAVEVARRTGRRLKVAAKSEPGEYPQYWKKILALLKEPFVDFVGEIGDARKSEFLGNADALIFPIQWPEPFGLAMIESLATGTPVIAFRAGAVPEIVRSGRTGFIVDDLRGACAAVEALTTLSREDCREDVLARFTRERMAREYLSLYRRLARGHAVHRVPHAISHAPGRTH